VCTAEEGLTGRVALWIIVTQDFGIAVFLWPRNSCLVLYVLYTDGKDVALKDNGGFRG